MLDPERTILLFHAQAKIVDSTSLGIGVVALITNDYLSCFGKTAALAGRALEESSGRGFFCIHPVFYENTRGQLPPIPCK